MSDNLYSGAKRTKTVRPVPVSRPAAPAAPSPPVTRNVVMPSRATPCPQVQVRMVHEKTTPGAYRFREIDADGLAVNLQQAIIGTIYIRKTSIKTPNPPTGFVVTLTFDE